MMISNTFDEDGMKEVPSIRARSTTSTNHNDSVDIHTHIQWCSLGSHSKSVHPSTG